MSEVLDSHSKSDRALPLDPFGAHPQWASRIDGLGGDDAAPDRAYVFRTLDFRPALGRVAVEIRFHDLEVHSGGLEIAVLARTSLPGSGHAPIVKRTLGRKELASAGGVAIVAFESHRSTLYALACRVTSEDAGFAASHISVTLDRRASTREHDRPWLQPGSKPTPIRLAPGLAGALAGRFLTSLAPPTLAEPVSQPGSFLQCREEAFVRAMRALHHSTKPSADSWSIAFVIQALSRFRARSSPGRMLAYVGRQSSLMSYFAAQGNEIVGLRHVAPGDVLPDPGKALEGLLEPKLCAEETFFDNARFIADDIRRPLDVLYDQFDSAWSIGANRVMTTPEYVHFAVNSLAQVRPGGVVIHVFDFIDAESTTRPSSLTRHDVERLTALAMSHGNDVAMLKFRHDAKPPEAETPLPFGIVLLRGRPE